MCSSPAKRIDSRDPAKFRPLERSIRSRICCAAVWLLAMCCAWATALGSDGVTLWRTPVSDRDICALTGRSLSLPPDFPAPSRVWAGLLTVPDGGAAGAELHARHARQVQELTVAWQRELNDGRITQSELNHRLRQTQTFRPRYFDVVVAETGQDVSWFLDDNLNGQLTLQGTVRSSVEFRSSDRSAPLRLTLTLTADRSAARIEPRGVPDLPAPPKPAPVIEPTTTSPQQSAAALQRQLTALDHPAVRKLHLLQIIDVADRLIARLDHDEEQSVARLAEVLYRRGRALGYRELPDVIAVTPIEDQAALHRDFEANFSRLQSLVDVTQPQYILLAIRRERRRGYRGTALDLLSLYHQHHPQPLWYHKKRSDLLNELKLELPAHQAAAELWLFGQRPHRPVPVVVRAHSDCDDAMMDVSWKPQKPWRSESLLLTRCSDSAVEGVVWLPPHETFAVQSPSSERVSATVDAAFVAAGATLSLPE